MTKMSKIKISPSNLVIEILGILIAIAAGIYHIVFKRYDRAIYSFLIPLIYIVPLTIQLVFRLKLNPAIENIIMIYMILAANLGVAWGFYGLIDNYDRLMHFSFGPIGCVIGLLILSLFKDISKENTVFIVIFMFISSMAGAALWELFEFSGDVFLNGTAQGTPVFVNGEKIVSLQDTMEDIACNFFGALLFSIYYPLEKKLKLKGITTVNEIFLKLDEIGLNQND